MLLVSTRLAFEFIFFSAFFQQTGVSLMCYSCYSKVNWTQCDENRERVICEPWLDVCAKSHVTFEPWGKPYDVYERGCFANNLCNPKACKYVGRPFNAKHCDIECCDLELCNGGVLSRDSKILIGCTVAVTVICWVWFRF